MKPILMSIILNKHCFRINKTLRYLHDMFDIIYNLRGIVYRDGNHFVSRLITKDGKMWYHNGITTGSNCIFEGKLDQIPDNEWLMTSSKGFSCCKAVLVIYARD
jgi:hypothetical protein